MLAVHFRRLSLLAAFIASGAAFASDGVQPGGQALKPVALAQYRALKGQEAIRVKGLARNLEDLRPRLGLRYDDGFVELSRTTDAFGRTHARFQQTHKGLKVWGGAVLASVGPAGEMGEPRSALRTNVQMANVQPDLSPDQAVALALKHLGAASKDCVVPPSVELVILQSRDVDGPKFKLDPKTHHRILDTEFSVAVEVPRDANLLGYHLAVNVSDHGQVKSRELILDARTGSILKKWDGTRRADIPAVGKGKSAYYGEVPLDVCLPDPAALLKGEEAGSYTLRDTTRATKAHPVGVYKPTWGGIGNKVGLFTNYDSFGGDYADFYHYASPTNGFGDGKQWECQHFMEDGVFEKALSPNGQTTAVDAHFAISQTWDFFKKFFDRDGIDGEGTSILTFVHMRDGYTDGRVDNAGWNQSLNVMAIGDGTYPAGNPDGWLSLSSLDIIVHEFAHGVCQYTAGLKAWMEADGINEADSDFWGTMVEHWTKGGRGPFIPNTAPGANWTVGEEANPKGLPLRYLYKPSLDGKSFDAWFDGMGMEDCHYTCGPLNRALYFLAQGTHASDPNRQSPYLPEGMGGVGNHTTAQIWYHALSTKIADPFLDMHGARTAALEAAAELFGANSVQVTAVDKAFQAANIVPKDSHLWVDMAQPTPNSFFNPYGLYLAAGRTNQLKATVHNARTNPALTWSLGGLPGYLPGGKMTPEGVYTAPDWAGYIFPVTATSKEDPRQFAVGMAVVLNVDCNLDVDTDAIDAGYIALEFGKPNRAMNWPAARVLESDQIESVGDLSVYLYNSAFTFAFNN